MCTQTLAFDRPLDLARSLQRYTRWGSDSANVVDAGRYHRVASGGTAYRATQSAAGTVEITVTSGDIQRAERDLRHRLSDRLAHPGTDALGQPAVREMFDRIRGFRPPLTPDPFESIITSITAQQVNLRWATTTRRRLVQAFGERHDIDGVEVWAFPTPGRLAGASVADLRALQFTTSKCEFIVGVAQAALLGAFDCLDAMTDQEVIDAVTDLRGVGRWTADWLLARCLGRGTAVAAGDLGVRKAMSWFVAGTEGLVSEDDVRGLVAPWGDGANWSVHLLLERLADR
jgi:DNA-3-methyladenine glycosylase II